MKRKARIARCYINQAIEVNSDIALDKRCSHHLSTVLRARAGQAVQLFNGDGKNYPGTVSATGKQTIVSVGDAIQAATESSIKITLVQAIARGDKMDAIVQKATELGVNCIQPVYSNHSITKLEASREERKLAHWQSIMISACEQSGRATLANIAAISSLSDYLIDAQIRSTDEQRWILSPSSNSTLKKTEKSKPEKVDSAVVMIGPESGFDADEIELAKQHHFATMQLGPRVLRTETAGPAVIAVLQAQYGDMY